MIILDLERVEALMSRHKLNQKSLAHKARLHENTVCLVMQGKVNPSLNSINKMAAALDVSGFTILKEIKGDA